MDEADKERLAHLAAKLDIGGLTTAEQFELAHLVRVFIVEYDENLAELQRRLHRDQPHGWGYPH